MKTLVANIDVWQVTVWVGKSQKRRFYPQGCQKRVWVCTHSLPSFLPSFLPCFHLSILPFFQSDASSSLTLCKQV